VPLRIPLGTGNWGDPVDGPGANTVGWKALLWDVDGTLAETELHGHRLAFNHAFKAAGLPWRWDEATYRQLLAISGGRERIRHFLEHHQRGPVSASLVESLMGAKQEAYATLARTGPLPLCPGVQRLVSEAARHGLPQALVTTSSRSAVAALMEGHGPVLADAFAFWICGEDVNAKKPSPEGYQVALNRLNLASTDVLVLEDSPQGLAAARGAALPCLLTLGDHAARANHALPSEASPWWQGARAAVNHLGDGQRPTSVLLGPPCQEGRVTLSWLQRLMEGQWADHR
jgi:HAD superfamily hydrolase (TIGR01509 family)